MNNLKCTDCGAESFNPNTLHKTEQVNGFYRAYDKNLRPIPCGACDCETVVKADVEFKGWGVIGKWSAQNKEERAKSLKARAKAHSRKETTVEAKKVKMEEQLKPVLNKMKSDGQI